MIRVLGRPKRVRSAPVEQKTCPLTDPSPMGRFPQGPVHPAGPLFLRSSEHDGRRLSARSRHAACAGLLAGSSGVSLGGRLRDDGTADSFTVIFDDEARADFGVSRANEGER